MGVTRDSGAGDGIILGTWDRLPGAMDPARNKGGAGVVNPGAGDELKTSGLTGTFEQKSTCNLRPIASIPLKVTPHFWHILVDWFMLSSSASKSISSPYGRKEILGNLPARVSGVEGSPII